MYLRNAFLRVAAVSLALALPLVPRSSVGDARAAEPAATASPAKLGSGAPPERADSLGARLRIVPSLEALPAEGVSFLEVMKDIGTPGSPKFEARGILDVGLDCCGSLRVPNARIVLTPAADGRTAGFEASGTPFGATSKLDVTGTVEWGVGPAGGDKVDMEFRLDDAPVDAVRTWLPKRIDPAFSGVIGIRGKASGIVGEKSTEEMPATPLRGEFDATIDLTALGRTGPMTVRSQFSMDDRMVRLKDGKMSWQGESLDLKGWSNHGADGDFELTAGFANVDTLAVATRWDVPPPWRPTSTLTGALTLKGKPGKGLLRYEAKAPLITLPALGGYDVRIENARLVGGLLEINAEAMMSVRGDRIVVGGIDLASLPIGVRWWRNELHVNNSNSQLFGGENDGSISYEPAKHPEFSFNGRIKNARAAELVRNLAPWTGLDVEGSGSVAFVVGQDKERNPKVSFHGSLTQGRLGGVDLVGGVLAALAKADPALALKDAATLVPVPRAGKGTRADRWFFEADKSGDAFQIGGMFLRSGDFQLDADGSFTRENGVQIDGTLNVPPAVSSQLVAAAPWFAALRHNEAALFVPVTVRGPLASPTIELAPGYAEEVAKAKRGEPVTAPGVKVVRHVGPEGLASIPADPANEMQQ